MNTNIATNERAITSTWDMRHPHYPGAIYAGVRTFGVPASDRYDIWESVDDPNLVIHVTPATMVTSS